MKAVTLFVPWDPISSAPNVMSSYAHTRNIRAIARVKRDSKTAAMYAWQKAGEPVSDVPVHINILVKRRTRMDPDNALAGLKWVFDALFNRSRNGTGIVPEDSEKWVEYGPVHVMAHTSYQLATVELTVYERSAPAAEDTRSIPELVAHIRELEEENTRLRKLLSRKLLSREQT